VLLGIVPDYRLAVGDTLFLVAGKHFERDHHAAHDFLVIIGYCANVEALRPYVVVLPFWAPVGEPVLLGHGVL
jgi:hypothetical protein